MKRFLAVFIGLLLVFSSIYYVTPIRKARLPQERLGYKPRVEVLYFSSLDYKLLLSEFLFIDTTFYYGALTAEKDRKPDYLMLMQYLDTATQLNPYNADAYYFGQAILTWEAGMVKEMNALLKRGVSKRTWDFYIPFFLGFNYSYFLNDKTTAAEYTALAAKLNPQAEYLPTLAGRLYYEANKTDQAISYLKVVLAGTNREMLRRALVTRITALETVSLLENAARQFALKTGHSPHELSELVSARILKAIPPDPYGGEFYIDRQDGRIKTTSKMSFTGAKNERH